MNCPKYQYFNGLKFTRDDETGYYLNSTIRRRMHRYVWEYYHGSIPKFYQIHHKDGNRANNAIDNLEMISVGVHQRLHGEKLSPTERQMRRDNLIENAVPKAVVWHKSDAGREWHKQNGAKNMENRTPKSMKCQYRGKDFITKQYGSKFCSDKCKSAFRRSSGVDNIMRVCAVCGKEFTVNKYSTTQTCSRSCANVLMHKEKGHNMWPDEEKICEVCGKPFITHGRSYSKTCSRSCAAVLAHRTGRQDK